MQILLWRYLPVSICCYYCSDDLIACMRYSKFGVEVLPAFYNPDFTAYHTVGYTRYITLPTRIFPVIICYGGIRSPALYGDHYRNTMSNFCRVVLPE